jgi:hypothetical protein
MRRLGGRLKWRAEEAWGSSETESTEKRRLDLAVSSGLPSFSHRLEWFFCSDFFQSVS